MTKNGTVSCAVHSDSLRPKKALRFSVWVRAALPVEMGDWVHFERLRSNRSRLSEQVEEAEHVARKQRDSRGYTAFERCTC